MTRVFSSATVSGAETGDGVVEHALVPTAPGSELSAGLLELAPAAATTVAGGDVDTVLYATGGSGSAALAGAHHGVAAGTAVLVPAGVDAVVTAGPEGLRLIRCSVGAGADVHAPLGPRDAVVHAEHAASERATGSRSAEVLASQANGFLRATLFAGHIPPGKAPWHYHLYDEIVWILHGEGRLHLDGGSEQLGPGSVFRLTPRELHIVENTSATDELVVLGFFTPAGSPTAAYLPAGSAYEAYGIRVD